MSYTDRFSHADDVVSDLRVVIPVNHDPLLVLKYVGFVSVAAVTVYELAIKEIFKDFAKKKHKVLVNFTENYFFKINGRIKISILKDEYIKKFGDKYVVKFNNNLNKEKYIFLQAHRRDFLVAYANIIVWRNKFAHEGSLSTNVTFQEVIQAYEDGKNVIHCLYNAMKR